MVKKFIIIGRAEAILIQFVEFRDGTQSYIKYWFDLRDLDNTIFEDKFRVFVKQEEKSPVLDVPQIFVTMIVESESRAEALKDNLGDLNAFLSNLSIVFNISFRLFIDGITCLDLTGTVVNDLYEFDLDFEKELKIVWLNPKYIKPTEKEGLIKTTGTPLHSGYTGSIKHDSILDCYFTHYSPNDNDIKIAAETMPAETKTNIITKYSEVPSSN